MAVAYHLTRENPGDPVKTFAYTNMTEIARQLQGFASSCNFRQTLTLRVRINRRGATAQTSMTWSRGYDICLSNIRFHLRQLRAEAEESLRAYLGEPPR